MYLSLSLPIKTGFSISQKLWDLLDSREKVDKRYTKYILDCVVFYNGQKILSVGQLSNTALATLYKELAKKFLILPDGLDLSLS